MKKKSQIQMMETIGVLFVFFLIVAIGMIFYTNIMKGQFQETVEKFQEKDRIEIVQLVSSLPELQCTQDNELKSNCIDLLKIEHATSVINSNIQEYFDLFAYSNITIKQIYPNSTKEWNIYSFNSNSTKSSSKIFLPISLFNASSDSYLFGVMTVEVFQ